MKLFFCSLLFLLTLESTVMGLPCLSSQQLSEIPTTSVPEHLIHYPPGSKWYNISLEPIETSDPRWVCLQEDETIEPLELNIADSGATPADPTAMKHEFDELCRSDFANSNNAALRSRRDQFLRRALETPAPENINRILLLFSKPGGFQPTLFHWKTFESIARSRLPYQRLLLNDALAGISYASPIAYMILASRVAEKLPQTLNLNSDGEFKEQSCKSAGEINLLTHAAKQTLELFSHSYQVIDSVKQLKPLKPYLSKQTALEKDLYINLITEDVLFYARGFLTKYPIFTSKLYILIEGAVREIFGDPVRDYVDLEIARTNGVLPFIVSNRPIDLLTTTLQSKTVSDDNNDLIPSLYLHFGIHLQPFVKIEPSDQNIHHEIKWKIAGKEIRALIDVKQASNFSDFRVRDAIPDYSSMKKEGLNGMIVIADSIDKKETRDLVSQYKNYYLSQRFSFSETDEPDFATYFLGKVSGGEVDYILKEAHSEGDLRNLFSATKRVRVLRGTKKLGEQVIERIELIYAPEKLLLSNNTLPNQRIYIENRKFGAAIREREQRNSGPLVFISNSCHSDVKAVSEIEDARSPQLIVIPTTNVSFGGPIQNRALATLLEFLRAGKSFPAMRTQMALSDSKYQAKTYNHFIFPDESIYEERIYRKLTKPLDISVRLFDQNGEEYYP